MKHHFMQRLVESADLPGESLPGQPLLELFGDNRVLIENHLGITEYGTEKIQIRVAYGALCVCGQRLQLCRMQGNQLFITGRIDGISLIRGRS